MIAAWHDGVLYFSTGAGEQKARNLAHDGRCALTTGKNALTEGLDLVVEGRAEPVADRALLEEGIAAYEAKYGPHMTSPEGTFHGIGEAFRRGRGGVRGRPGHGVRLRPRQRGVFPYTVGVLSNRAL